MIVDNCEACEYSMLQGRDLYFCNVKGKYITHCFDCYTYRLYNTLQEIKAIAEEYLTDCQGFKCEAMEEILQKITKAEVE